MPPSEPGYPLALLSGVPRLCLPSQPSAPTPGLTVKAGGRGVMGGGGLGALASSFLSLQFSASSAAYASLERASSVG